LKPLFVYSLFDTHSAVGFACREASFVNKASLLPHVTSPVNPASVLDMKKILSTQVSVPPPSTDALPTVCVVFSKAARKFAENPARNPASPSYSL
jgi:hypothetical protein